MGRHKIIQMALVTVIAMGLPGILWAENKNSWNAWLDEKIQKGYSIEAYQEMETLSTERVRKRKEIENTLRTSTDAIGNSFRTIRGLEEEKTSNEVDFNRHIDEMQKQKKKVASNTTEFKYVPRSDGSISYSQGGLTTRVVNARQVDEHGNVSYKTMDNMEYNEKRLLIYYDAELTDELGNITRMQWHGKYTPDAVWFANDDTNANRNLEEWHTIEIDATGNVKETHFKTLEYKDKMATRLQQTIEDSVYGTTSFTRYDVEYKNGNYKRPVSYYEEGIGRDGKHYLTHRTNTEYNNKDQVTSYSETKATTEIDGTITTAAIEAQFDYLPAAEHFGPDVEDPDPDRIAESTVTTTTRRADGAERTETVTTEFKYGADKKLINSFGNSIFTGEEWQRYEYTFIDDDGQIHTLMCHEDDDGNATYSYFDADLKRIIVPVEEVIATIKDGAKYEGRSKIQYEIIFNKPMTLQVDSFTAYYGNNISDDELLRTEETTMAYSNTLINNLRRVSSTFEHTEMKDPLRDPDNSHSTVKEIFRTNTYDAKTNLSDAHGTGWTRGWEYSNERGWRDPFAREISIYFDIILGEAKQTVYKEVPDDKLERR